MTERLKDRETTTHQSFRRFWGIASLNLEKTSAIILSFEHGNSIACVFLMIVTVMVSVMTIINVVYIIHLHIYINI